MIYGVAVLLALFAAGIYFFTCPSATVASLQQAVAAKNYLALNELVDFPALRVSIKSNLAKEIEDRAAIPSSASAKLGTTLAQWMLNPMVDLVVSPIGIALILEGYSLSEAAILSYIPDTANAVQTNVTYASRWVSLSKYEVVVLRNRNPVSILRLHRYGLFKWKLAAVDLGPWLRGRP